MAYGTANVDVIQSSTAGTPPQFNDGNGTQIGKLCRAWINFVGGNPATVNKSFNVSSVTYVSTGTYTVNFTTALNDANYALAGSATSDGGNGRQVVFNTLTTTTADIQVLFPPSFVTGTAKVTVVFFD